MSNSPIPRLAIIAGWLLTPIVAWAASLLGGWTGALFAPKSEEGFAPFIWLLTGLVVGAIGGLVGWIGLMRLMIRRVMRVHQPAGENSG